VPVQGNLGAGGDDHVACHGGVFDLYAKRHLIVLGEVGHRIIGWKRPLRSSSPTFHPTPPCLPNCILMGHFVAECPWEMAVADWNDKASLGGLL